MVDETRARTRTRTFLPERQPDPPPVASRVIRQARPMPTPPPRTRSRTRSETVAPVPVTGLVTGIVDIERRVSGHVVETAQEIVHAPRRMPDGTFTPAMVHVGGAATVQPRQYESVKVTVGLTLPCYPDAAGYEGAYAEAVAWVQSKVAAQVEAVPID